MAPEAGSRLNYNSSSTTKALIQAKACSPMGNAYNLSEKRYWAVNELIGQETWQPKLAHIPHYFVSVPPPLPQPTFATNNLKARQFSGWTIKSLSLLKTRALGCASSTPCMGSMHSRSRMVHTSCIWLIWGGKACLPLLGLAMSLPAATQHFLPPRNLST